MFCVAQHRNLLLAGTYSKQVVMWDIHNTYCMVKFIETEQEVYNILPWDNCLVVTSGGSISRIKVWSVHHCGLLIDIGPHNGNNTNHMIRMGDCIVSCGNGDPRLLFLQFTNKESPFLKEKTSFRAKSLLYSCAQLTPQLILSAAEQVYLLNLETNKEEDKFNFEQSSERIVHFVPLR